MSREKFEAFTRRLMEQSKKNGGKLKETEARKIAANVAIRHDRKNNGK